MKYEIIVRLYYISLLLTGSPPSLFLIIHLHLTQTCWPLHLPDIFSQESPYYIIYVQMSLKEQVTQKWTIYHPDIHGVIFSVEHKRSRQNT